MAEAASKQPTNNRVENKRITLKTLRKATFNTRRQSADRFSFNRCD